MGVIELFNPDGSLKLNGVSTGQYSSPPVVLQPAIVPKAPGRICSGCRSVGFAVSALGPDRCTFCDGTEGGNPPTLEEILAASQQARAAQRGSVGPSAPEPPAGAEGAAPAAGVEGPAVPLPQPPADPGVGALLNQDLLSDVGASIGWQPPSVTNPTTPTGERDVQAEIDTHLPFCYLAGAAGTGKTTIARTLIDRREDAILCATTGIAAVNLGDATTINSLIGYFDTQSLMEHYASGYLQQRLRALRRSGVRTIVLDEVSMLDADQLTTLCQAFDEVDSSLQYDEELEKVETKFTGDDKRLKLVLVGDFAQLPPVKAPYAFESPEWSRFHDHTIRLTRIHRQDNQQFVTALQAVRKGRASEALQVLEPCLTPTLDFSFPGTTIVAQNDEVDRINHMRHSKLAGLEYDWPTKRSGEQQKDWIRLIPETVTLKKGALVMILANKRYPKLDESDTPAMIYANGDLATVVGKEQTGIRVFLHRTFEEVVVTPFVKEWKQATGKRNPRWEIKGSVIYMPLRLAYATTVHKSQGLTLDQVQVSIHNWMFTKPGMTYVALSRARSLEGLRIVGNAKMFLGRCAVERKITQFL